MANTTESILALMRNTCEYVCRSPEEWQDFLSCACNNYKLPFEEQLLLYAQRPDATAVLEFHKWNKRFGRKINRGAKGIAVLVAPQDEQLKLKYYFDISDTSETEISKPVPIWRYKPEYEQDVIEVLEDVYGTLDKKENIADAVFSAAKNAVADDLPIYTENLHNDLSESFLEGLDDDSVSFMFRNTVQNSIAFMFLSRFGYNASEYFDRIDFEHIVNFNTIDTIATVGLATSEIAGSGLSEIAKTIFALEKDNRTFADKGNDEYNEVETKNERSAEYDNQLHREERSTNSQLDNAEKQEFSFRKVGEETQRVSSSKSQSNVPSADYEGRIGQELGTNGRISNPNGTRLDDTNGSTGRLNGEAQSNRYDDLGTGYEQSQEQSNRNRDGQGNLHPVNDVLPPLIDSDAISYILDNPNDDLKDKKEDIVEFFISHNDITEIKEYVKTLYPETNLSYTYKNKIFGCVSTDNGLLMWEGNYPNHIKESVFSWEIVSNLISNSIESHTYLDIQEPENHNSNPQFSLFDYNDGVPDTYEVEAEESETHQTIVDSISIDEINQFLRGNESNKDYRVEIYDFFKEHTDVKSRADYLKKRYGVGGQSGGGFIENHNADGITISHGSIMHPTATISLKWNKVAYLIDLMLSNEAFLYPDDYAEKDLEHQDYEINCISKLLEALQIDDVNHGFYENGEFFAVDADGYHWNKKEFYDFLLNDCLSFDYNGDLIEGYGAVTDEILNPILKLAKNEGVTPNIPKPKNAPFFEEYRRIQDKYPNHIICYQMGDFFEVMGTDASIVAKELDLVITSRTINFQTNERIALVGFPKHNLDKYVNGLVNLGYKVAIATLENDTRETKTLIPENPKIEEANNDNDVVGKEVVIDGSKFIIESVKNGYVEMKDISFQNNVGFPVFRKEHIENVLPYIIEQESQVVEQTIPIQKPKKRQSFSFDLHPEISSADRINFDLANNEVDVVGKKERYKRNIEAIKLLHLLDSENRFATPDEQIILSKYVGWGGIPEAFDDKNSSWSNEYLELKGLLSDEEYSLARESTLTAFYTPPNVISAMYKVVDKLGFKQGNILEPCCAIGNFIGMLPKEMQDSSIYGIELDSISASIAQQLYQKSSILNIPFEKANIPDSFFDVVIGNVPFGDFKLSDKRYDKHNFLIHDYFFAKSLDKLRAGGIMLLVTSKGTMDKENSAVRKYISQRADLLGAIRLPNDTFKGNAGTEVVSDILVLQKRERLLDIEPTWVQLDNSEDGIRMNRYFVEHPEMVLGEMTMKSSRFGVEATCVPYEDRTLEEQFEVAIQNIQGHIKDYEISVDLEENDDSIPATPDVRNFSFTLVEDKIYFRENSRMTPTNVNATAEKRIRGLIKIRDSVRRLIELQTEDFPDEEIKDEQKTLNELYDAFTGKYGLINSRGNRLAFEDDSSYHLISALEIIDENGELVRKADMFSKRTIKPHIPVTSVDTSTEALAVSIGEKARIDIPYMMQLSNKTEDEIFSDLQGVIFLNPLYNENNVSQPKYLMADEYLSGNVREKLRYARLLSNEYPEFEANIKALEQVQPKDLGASEIDVRLGSTWIPPEIIKQFIFEVLETPYYYKNTMDVSFYQYSGEWTIINKNYDRNNVNATSTYGTVRMNAYKIIEETLNLKDVRVFDYEIDDEGKRKAILNKKETAIAQSKQELIKQKFKDWIWEEPERRNMLCQLYNEKFNSIRPREYDGSHINFVGMNPEISLRKHQRNAVAHILYGGNTLLAHAVGAGKTYEMVAAAQESKRLGLCSKSLFVVPNHLTEQWANEYLQLYPSANILVATRKDFETKNRKRFCGKIATGDYDAIIIGHSQFEKIPMSIERQELILNRQLDEILMGISQAKQESGNNFTVKQLEKSKKSIQAKLDKLNDQSRKDDVVTFEELGVDRIFIDESHYYKNLFLYTKMRNVSGIAQTEAQKSSDLFMKTQYLDEITGGRGTVFATGTPISNSMVELYTIQRYLQYNTLCKYDLQHFDSWASTFGETITAIELTPEGTGYRAKTRFAKFFNLPELMSMFKEIADIQTADMLDLPVPDVEYHNIAVKPSEKQTEIVESLSERAEKVRNGDVDSSQDNMLVITNDGRKLALDQRLIDPELQDEESSKVNACVDNVYNTWLETKEQKSVQVIFCDLSTPKSVFELDENNNPISNEFKDVYNDIRIKLIKKGIPKEEIAFAHEAKTEAQKAEMFAQARSGNIRVLIGSTQKMGAGTNIQNKLIALHDLDCPWRPSDLEQRSGRIIRQGNENKKVHISRYVTERTFDAYLYQLVEGKQKFASQIMSSKSPVRSAEDIDETALSYAEIKMLATGNPYIKEKMDLDIQVQKLRLLRSNFLSDKYKLEDKILKDFPTTIAEYQAQVEGMRKDIVIAKEHPRTSADDFAGMKVNGIEFHSKADAGEAIIAICKSLPDKQTYVIGEYRGFSLDVHCEAFVNKFVLGIKGKLTYDCELGADALGNITRIDNVIDGIQNRLEKAINLLNNTEKQLEIAKEQVKKSFPQEEELRTKEARLNELNALLNVDKRENEFVDGEPDASDLPNRNSKDRESR